MVGVVRFEKALAAGRVRRLSVRGWLFVRVEARPLGQELRELRTVLDAFQILVVAGDADAVAAGERGAEHLQRLAGAFVLLRSAALRLQRGHARRRVVR